KVQWQNESGSWIDVNGWQGSFHPKSSDTSLFVEWWVGSEILGDGPFRWVIYSDKGGTQYLSTSDSFSLPSSNLQTVVVVPNLLVAQTPVVANSQNAAVSINTIASSGNTDKDDSVALDSIDEIIDETVDELETASNISDTISTEPVTYFVSVDGDNSDGLSWETAWNEMDQIVWQKIKGGDVILLDGGPSKSEPMVYGSTLKPAASGDEDNPILIQIAEESGRNGQVVLFGGNDLPLPECGQAVWDGTAHQTAGETAIVFADGVSNITIDGRKRHGIVIHGWRETGITFDPDRTDNDLDDNTKNITLSYMNIYNNGDVVQAIDGDSADLLFPANDSPGIKLSGVGHTFSFMEIHDNAGDAIQSNFTNPDGGVFNNIDDFSLTDSWLYNQRSHSGADNSPIGEVCSLDSPDGCDELGAPQMAIDYHFYPEEPTNRREAFNWCTHNDGIQIYSSNDLNKMNIERSIIGPNLMTALLLGDRGGDTTTAWINDLTMEDVVITRFTHSALGMKNPPDQAGKNWKLDHVTIYGHFSNTNKGSLNLDSNDGDAEHMISNSTMVFGQTEFPNANVAFENNCEFNLYSGSIGGEQADPAFNNILAEDVFEDDLSVDFATVFADDYRPNNIDCLGSVARISSVDMLLSGFENE
ncbi:MAG: hypothetical protein AAGD96_04495, partial [Chloroflexota bacterium]